MKRWQSKKDEYFIDLISVGDEHTLAVVDADREEMYHICTLTKEGKLALHGFIDCDLFQVDTTKLPDGVCYEHIKIEWR